MKKLALLAVAFTAISTTLFLPAAAETRLLVGTGAGGGYDFAARFIAPFLEKHLGNGETVIVQNVPGAASLNLARRMQDSGADNEIGLILSSQIVQSRLNPERVSIDFSKFRWIGSVNSTTPLCLMAKRTGVDSFEKFIATDAKLGATAKTSGLYEIAAMLKAIFGAKYSIVTGFESLAEVDAALERGEIDGYCGTPLDRFLRGKMNEKNTVIGSLSTDVEIDGATVPSLMSRTADGMDRAAMELYASSSLIYYPLFMGPGASEDAVNRYRQAFDATIKDPEFLKHAEEAFSEMNPMDGPTLNATIDSVSATDAATVEHLRMLLE